MEQGEKEDHVSQHISGVQKESGTEEIRTYSPRNIYVYCLFIPILRIIRELGIQSILDSLFREEDRNAILVLAASRSIRSIPMELLHPMYDGTYLVKEYLYDLSSQHISGLLEDIVNSSNPDRFFSFVLSCKKSKSSLLLI
ncbi:MAG: hypothetical protein QXO75_06065 [Nitrososphaerota archaeon]